MSKWIVEEQTHIDGWVNTWLDDNGAATFDSEADAQAELDWYLHDMQIEFEAGNVADVPDRDTFRIVQID